jgi:hypothetical protein
MDDTAKLLAIEEIKQLKARYFYGYDHRTGSTGATRSGRPKGGWK